MPLFEKKKKSMVRIFLSFRVLSKLKMRIVMCEESLLLLKFVKTCRENLHFDVGT